MYCWKCGEELPDDARSCLKCGADTNWNNSPPDNLAVVYKQSGGIQEDTQAATSEPYTETTGPDKAPNTSSSVFNNISQTSVYDPEPEKALRTSHKKKKIIIIAAACAALLAVVIPTVIITAKAGRYETASSMINSDPLEAKAIFLSLGNYSDAAQQAEECQMLFDYNTASALMDSENIQGAMEAFLALGDFSDAAQQAEQCQLSLDYNAATALMKSGDMQGALEGFRALGDYSDSSQQVGACQISLDYDAATALMKSGDMQGALEGFQALGDYSDSAQRAEECRMSLDYDAAVSLMNRGDNAGAYDAFIALGSYKDSVSLAEECRQKRDYEIAGLYFSQDKYYSAYVLYTSLGDYLDSAKLAESCLQPLPKTGEIYRDPIQKNIKLSDGYGYDKITFKAPKDGNYTYIQITGFLESDPCVKLFLAPGKKVTVKLWAGSYYTFQEAYGAVWYGEKEMFGDDGTYFTMQFEKEDGQTTDTLYLDVATYTNEYYVYTIKLRQ